METNTITTIARQELVINIRNRWTLVFACVFGILVLSISYFGLVTSGSVGFQGFARTSASLLNMVLYIVPLVALVTGTLSFTSEKSAGELLFPVSDFSLQHLAVQPLTLPRSIIGVLNG